MLKGKERAYLRSAANGLDPVYQIGKDGITPKLIEGVEQVLKARELIKLTVLETCPLCAREAAVELCSALGAEPVQVIGGKCVIYRRNMEIDNYGI